LNTTPNTQSPIPNPQSPIPNEKDKIKIIFDIDNLFKIYKINIIY